MISQKKFVVSHAPFWHDRSNVQQRSTNVILAALPAVVVGLYFYGSAALGVVALSVSSAILWELIIDRTAKRPITIGDGNAAVIGLLYAMLLPATMPWWAVITGTFVAVIIGKTIFGGIGGNAFNPVALSVAILAVSWPHLFDFDGMLVNYDFGVQMMYPLTAAKYFGSPYIEQYQLADLLIGRQAGGIGASCGLALIAGGVYLILRGFIRWEIAVSFLAGVFITALVFNTVGGDRYAGPLFHLFTGYTLVGAFFLATEDSSSPVNFVPMLIYGAAGGIVTVLIRNIGAYVDGVVYAVLVINLINPLLDNIRPKAIGKVV